MKPNGLVVRSSAGAVQHSEISADAPAARIAAGASVAVTMGGALHTVTAGADGNWSAVFTSAEIPTGAVDLTVHVSAIDIAGNLTSTCVVLDETSTSVVDMANPALGGSISKRSTCNSQKTASLPLTIKLSAYDYKIHGALKRAVDAISAVTLKDERARPRGRRALQGDAEERP